MRLSPVLVAVFTASATFGLSNSANGQTAYSESESSLSSQEAFEPINPSLNQSETHAKPSLDVNQSIPSTPINSFEGIVLNKTNLKLYKYNSRIAIRNALSKALEVKSIMLR